MASLKQPLDGITVLDLTQVYNGPYATYLMANAGADVIKVEPPGGEFLRRRNARAGSSVPFLMLNGNKRSVSLNLKLDAGKQLFLDLVAHADVVVENYAPGVVDRLGIGYEAAKAVNGTIIYASGSGYGQSGAYRLYPAMDLTVQAMSGIMSTTGFSENPPVKAGGAVCDFFGGVHLFGAVMTAIVHRERNGEGTYLDVAMLDAVYPSMASNIGGVYSGGGDVPLRTGNQHGGLSLCPYNVYAARDGHFAIICNHDEHWQRLAATMGCEELGTDPRYLTVKDRVEHMEEVDSLIEAWSRNHDRNWLFDQLIGNRVPCAPVRELNEAMQDEHLHERGMLLEIDDPTFGKVVICRSPIKFVDRPPPPYQSPPHFGEHNQAVYGGWLGLNGTELDKLRADSVI